AFTEKEVHNSTNYGSQRQQGKEKITFNPEIPPFEGGENLGSIFAAAQAEMEAEPSSSATTNPSKRPRSNTTSSLRNYQPEQDPGHYWSRRYLKKVREYPSDMTFHNFAMIFVGFLGELQTDYTTKCDTLQETMMVLADTHQKMADAINRSSLDVHGITGMLKSYNITQQFDHINDAIMAMQFKLSSPEFRNLGKKNTPSPGASGSIPEPTPPPPPPPPPLPPPPPPLQKWAQDRKSTRLNSSHLVISYAVFC